MVLSVRKLLGVAGVLAAVATPLAAPALTGRDADADAADARGLSLPAMGAVRSAGFSRTAVVVMENKGYHQIIGNPHASFINRLADRYALATNFYAVTHP